MPDRPASDVGPASPNFDPTELLAGLRRDLSALFTEVERVIVGQRDILEGVITCLLGGGHALLEGVPGLGKTRLVRAVADALGATFSRIQFTPDLMPADIVGTSVLLDAEGGRTLTYQPGPIFAHVVLADEVNRATPKTQSALLEAMAEGTVTAAGQTRPLPRPFLVLATQNPLEMEGTYPLPEAQLDRFLLKLVVEFPGEDELVTILERTTGAAPTPPRPVLSAARVVELQGLLRAIPVAPTLTRYVARLLRATHPAHPDAPEIVRRYVRFGASPRGAQAMLTAARVRAVLAGRVSPSRDDVAAVVPTALRHRLILNFEGEAEGILVDDCLAAVVRAIASDDR